MVNLIKYLIYTMINISAGPLPAAYGVSKTNREAVACLL